MQSARTVRDFGRKFGTQLGSQLDNLPTRVTDALPRRLRRRRHPLLTTLGWISAGAGTLGIGLILGRELRRRYKFHRRTPYDVYSHAGGGYNNDVEFGVGV